MHLVFLDGSVTSVPFAAHRVPYVGSSTSYWVPPHLLSGCLSSFAAGESFVVIVRTYTPILERGVAVLAQRTPLGHHSTAPGTLNAAISRHIPTVIGHAITVLVTAIAVDLAIAKMGIEQLRLGGVLQPPGAGGLLLLDCK